MKGPLICFFLLFFIGCADEGDTSADNSVIPSSEDKVEEYMVPAPNFHQFLRRGDNSYRAEKYNLEQTLPLDLERTEKLDTNIIVPFKAAFNFNASRTKALDLFSANYVLTQRSGSLQAARGEPDTELLLLDFAAGTQTRLLYVGPSYLLTDAVWMDDHTIGVTGGEIITENKIQPLLWKMDLYQKVITLYRYSDTLNAKMDPYLRERYPGLPL